MDNKVYTNIISLGRASNRVRNVRSQSKRLRNFRIFSAIDSEDVEGLDRLKKEHNVHLSGGRAGCALSHICLLNQFIQSEEKYTIILEDDCVILDALPTSVSEVEKLFRDIGIVRTERVDILYLSQRIKCNKRREITGGCGTEGYVFSRSGAKKALKVLDNLTKPVDLRLQGHYPRCRQSVLGFGNKEYSSLRINAYKSGKVYIRHVDQGISYITRPSRKRRARKRRHGERGRISSRKKK